MPTLWRTSSWTFPKGLSQKQTTTFWWQGKRIFWHQRRRWWKHDRRVLDPQGHVNIFLCWSLLPSKKPFIFLLCLFPLCLSILLPFYDLNSHQFPPLTPTVLVKHPIWYLDHANLFISVWGTLYGVHWAYFDDSNYFRAIMDILNPLFVIPRGYLPHRPVPFNNLDEMLLHWLISYLYKPTEFPNIKSTWELLKWISIGWYMPQVAAMAIWKLINIQYQNMPLSQCTMLQHFTTHAVSCQQWMMWWHQHKHPSTRDGSGDIDLIKDD